MSRPKALNALTPDMCHGLLATLRSWRDAPDIHCIVIDGAGERAFCAGGDIAEVYAQGRKGNARFAQEFWREEYVLNLALSISSKPVVSLMHGFTLGGGVGVGCHAQHRVVCENSQIGLPETAIGLVTDVGGTHLLSRAPGRLGDYLALTAARMGPGEAIAAGFADHFVLQEHWPEMLQALCETGNPDIIARFASPPPPATLLDEVAEIEAALSQRTLTEVIDALERNTAPIALKTLETLRKNDPLAMAASRQLIAEARHHGSLKDALAGEYRYTHRAIQESDFLEGIRSRIIDRDNAPRWTYGFDDAEIAATRLLATLGANALWGLEK